MNGSPALGRVLDRAFAREKALVCALGLDQALTSARGLNHALVEARGLSRALVDALDDDLVGPRDTDLARTHTRARALAVDLSLDIIGARGLAPDLDRLRGTSAELVGVLKGFAGHAAPVVRVRVVVCAGWLVGWALRVVPAGERSRYGEEWRGELWDLAEGSGRWRRQTVHAVRTLACAWSVRAGIREGRRRPAGGS